MLDEIIEEFKKLKEHYVYTLVDERNGAVFYVGKGVGERAHHHGKEAGSSDADTEKLNKIREIEKSGYSVIPRVIGRYETEAEAFAVESTLIHWMYGIDNLTNRQNGHGSDSIRSKGNFETIEGIDIPKRISSVDGTYSREYIAKREENGIIPYVEEVKKYLEEELNIRFSDINESMAKETSISYEINKKIKIVIGTGHSSSQKIFIYVLPNQEKEENKFILEQICNETIFELKNHGKYARMKDFKSTRDREKIKEDFMEHKKLLTQALRNLNTDIKLS